MTALEQVQDLQRQNHADVEAALLTLNATSVLSVAGARYAGITIVDDHGEITTMAPTHDYPRYLDDVQRATNEGPCLSAAWTGNTFLVDDLVEEVRWPRYREVALTRTPIRSVLSLRLATEGDRMAALSFYADAAGVFDDESVELGLIFASHTAVAWTAIDRERQYQSALASCDAIGQATGMLMERFGIDAVAAFELLRKLSQQDNGETATVAKKLTAAIPSQRMTDHLPS